jgi:hypothetical protein
MYYEKIAGVPDFPLTLTAGKCSDCEIAKILIDTWAK